MPKERSQSHERATSKQSPPRRAAAGVAPSPTRPRQGDVLRRAVHDPGSLTPRAVLQLQRAVGNRASGKLLSRAVPPRPIQLKENRTGLPDELKAGVENLSGFSLDDVKVHYNSPKPAQLNALAYTQGTDIHVAPGQEQHLPHEAWHVVQQKQGRVKATPQLRGEAVNDDAGLEREADLMGAHASSRPPAAGPEPSARPTSPAPHQTAGQAGGVVQLKRQFNQLRGVAFAVSAQWPRGNHDFHVTVYRDDAGFINPHNFVFISDRWSSEFHVSDKSVAPAQRRYYNIDNGAVIAGADEHVDAADRGRFDTLAGQFIAAQNAVQIYNDGQAQAYEVAEAAAAAQRAAAAAAAAAVRAGHIRQAAVAEAAARGHAAQNWNLVASYLVVNAIRRRLPQALQVPGEVPAADLQNAYDAALAAHAQQQAVAAAALAAQQAAAAAQQQGGGGAQPAAAAAAAGGGGVGPPP